MPVNIIPNGNTVSINGKDAILSGHPGIATAWARFDGLTVLASYNCTISDAGSGLYQCTFDTPMDNTNYAVIGMGSGGGSYSIYTIDRAADGGLLDCDENGFQFAVYQSGDAPKQDRVGLSIVVFGGKS